ncbi:28571_t:CDS:2, partial [Dentiscutata erythropus]
LLLTLLYAMEFSTFQYYHMYSLFNDDFGSNSIHNFKSNNTLNYLNEDNETYLYSFETSNATDNLTIENHSYNFLVNNEAKDKSRNDDTTSVQYKESEDENERLHKLELNEGMEFDT